MLSAGAAASIGIDADIIGVDDNVDVLLNIRHYVAGYKGSLSLSLCVERGDPYKPVYASLRFQVTVCVGSVDLEIHRFDAGLVAVNIVHDFNAESFAVCPSCIHSVEHGAPVAALRAARSGV